MFRKFHERLKDHEEGFTLIELLVVILIIAILAAIAIPVFLNQRKKGYYSQTQSALKNAATSMESFATANAGAYPTTTSALAGEGYRPVDNVNLTIVSANSDTDEFCLKAEHAKLETGDDWDIGYWDSDVGRPSEDACTSN